MRNESYKVHINQLVGKYMTRMIRMNELIGYAYAGSIATSITVIIDLYSIKNSIMDADFDADGYDLCSAILDMVVHYKNYFYGLGVSTTFILIDSNNRPMNSVQKYPGYNAGYSLKLTSGNYKGIKANLNVLSQICTTLPSVHYISSEYEVAVVIAYLLSDTQLKDAGPAMIISRDMYMSLLFDLNLPITWLYPSKFKGDDVSWIADYRNIRSMVFNKIFGTNIYGDPETYIPRFKLSMIFAATKFPCRGFASILQLRTLRSMVENNTDIVWNMDELESRANGSGLRYKLLDMSIQLESYRLSMESRFVQNPAPKMNNIEALKLINNDLFAGTLQLDDLLK